MPGQDKHFATNEYFVTLERSEAFEDFQKLVQRALEDQWQEFVLSGIINTLYKEYKNYFKRPKNKRVKVSKAEGDDIEDQSVGNADELKQHEKDSLGGNKILIPITAIAIAQLLKMLRRKADEDLKSVGTYYSFKPKAKAYLKNIANKGGQTVIDKIETPKPLIFRLSNQEYVDKISQRINALVKSMDETTRERLVRELVKGVEAGERKSEMAKRLQKIGTDISKSRAKTIVATETQAITEFIRYETARLNGVKEKVWMTALDERVCPVCGPLHGKTINMGTNFSGGETFTSLFPPAHVNCRCWLEYPIDTTIHLDFLKSEKPWFDELIHKAKDAFNYRKNPNPTVFTITNPNAVWAGGESLVGPDKHVGNLYDAIQQDPDYKKNAERAMAELSDGSLMLDWPYFTPLSDTERLLVEARQTLTNAGFVQLLLRMGFNRKVPAKP